MAIRKNIRSLTAAEKSELIQAIKAIKASGQYDTYVTTHAQAMPTAHRGPAFLPWHREFLRRYEQDLQNAAGNPDLGLPYWDWTQDATNPTGSPVWANDLMGGNGDPSNANLVSAGPFAFNVADPNTWTIVDTNGNPAGGLRRSFSTSGSLPTPAEESALLAMTPYDAAPWGQTSATGFRNKLEGWQGSGPELHNQVHVWIGGDMTASTSPNDPVFFLHHAYVDKLWADWQRQHPGEQPFLPASGARAGHNLNDAMAPWTTTPADMLDHQALGYEYDTDPPGGGGTPGGGTPGGGGGCMVLMVAGGALATMLYYLL